MAPQSALGFCGLGAGLVAGAIACASSPELTERLRRHLPSIAGVTLLAVTIIYWMAMQQHFARQERLGFASAAISAKSELDNCIASRISSLEHMAHRWAFRSPSQPEWEHEVAEIIEHDKDFQAIAWIDTTGRARWIYPHAGDAVALDADLGSDPVRSPALRDARNLGAPALTPIVDLPNGAKGVIAVMPMHGAHDDGWIVGLLRIDDLLGSVIEHGLLLNRYHVRISQHGAACFTDTPSTQPPADAEHLPVELYGTTWDMDVWPKSTTSSAVSSHLHHVLLLLGVVAAALLSAALLT